MRDYLVKEEKDVWLTEALAAANTEDALPRMKSNLSKDEHKWLKMSVTLRQKAYDSMSKRLSEKAIRQLHKYAINCDIQVVSKEMSNIITENELKKQQLITIDFELFKNLAVSLMASKCENCTKNFSSCELFDTLDKIDLQGYCILDNCPYAFGREKTKETKIKKISKRREKKLKNKYDDDGEVYEYNFTPKAK